MGRRWVGEAGGVLGFVCWVWVDFPKFGLGREGGQNAGVKS